MNNENRHPNYTISYQQTSSPTIANKLATMLAVIVSFQQKIEILRVKICGHPNFSPQLYYKQIDRCEKGFIDSEDIVTFIKKSKPAFNVDHRYLKSLFVRLNQDERVPSDRLTYFGYLNIIKPYFDNALARDLLLRDSVAIGTQINVVAKKLLQDLICTLYVCVAQHERVKELIIIGDIQQGGREQGNFYNVYEMLEIIKQGSNSNTIPINIQSEPNMRSNTNIITNRNIMTQNNIETNVNIRQSYNPQIRSTTSISPNNPTSNIPSHPHINTHQNIRSGLSIQSNLSRRSKPSTLDTFHQFILNNSQYQIQRSDMKYLLAYLMCHQYMIPNDKYLTLLFMPVSALVSIPNSSAPVLNQPQKHFYSNQNVITSGQTNFLGFVHKNSLTRQAVEQERKRRQLNIKKNPPQPNPNPQKRYSSQKDIHNTPRVMDHEPRILINPSKNTMQTPILQKFLRESKVLKNMSRYQQQIQQQSSITSQSSAFIMQGKSVKNNSAKKQYLDPNINIEHTHKPINKDFSLHDMLQNSNVQRSQYYNNLNMRAYIKDQPLKPAQIISPRKTYDFDNNNSGILSNFMRK